MSIKDLFGPRGDAFGPQPPRHFTLWEARRMTSRDWDEYWDATVCYLASFGYWWYAVQSLHTEAETGAIGGPRDGERPHGF